MDVGEGVLVYVDNLVLERENIVNNTTNPIQ